MKTETYDVAHAQASTDQQVQPGLDTEKLHRISHERTLPSVVFAMRYPDDTGFVWNTIARTRDLAAANLDSVAKSFIAYPKLSGTPAYRVQHLHPVALECYDTSAEALAKLRTFIEENSVRVIVFMSALPSTLDLAFFKRLGVATVNTENDGFDHNQKDPLHTKLMKYILRRILKKQLHDVHLANAEAQFDFLMRYAHVPRARLALVRDAVDHDRFIPGHTEEACRMLKLDPGRLWIISVAQARPEKRVDMIIRAVKRVIDARPDKQIGFLFVGDGECISEWKETARDLLFEEQMHFAGRQENLVPYYQAAALMAHASRRESFGLAIVEGMACGLPVVATRSAGPSETIENGKTGVLVDPDDFDGMVNGLLRYVDSAALRIAHGTAGRNRVLEFYGMVRQGQELAGHIQRFLPLQGAA